jgi:two-component system, NarL family, invasion response regulator UvrY
MNPIRVLIADERPVVRRGLMAILADHVDVAVAGEVERAGDLLALVRQQQPDVIVLDVFLYGLHTKELVRTLKQQEPTRAVLLFSMASGPHAVERAFKAGAAGYLTRESTPEEVVGAIRKVATGGRYVSLTIAEQLATEVSARPREVLSDREYEVMCLLASGKPVPQVASELSLSAATVKTYRARTLHKMHLHTNAQLVRYALEHDLGECGDAETRSAPSPSRRPGPAGE